MTQNTPDAKVGHTELADIVPTIFSLNMRRTNFRHSDGFAAQKPKLWGDNTAEAGGSTKRGKSSGSHRSATFAQAAWRGKETRSASTGSATATGFETSTH